MQWMACLQEVMDSVYDLYRRGCELLAHGDYQAAIVPLTRARELGARQGLDPRGARPRAVPRPALRGRRGGVPRGRRAGADQRLRALLPGPRDAAARPPPRTLATRSRSPARCARSAATTASTGTARCAPPMARRSADAMLDRQLSCRRCGRRLSHREWAASPAFFIVRRAHDATLQTEIEERLAASEPDVEVLLVELARRRDAARLHRPPRGRHARALRARHASARRSCASATRSRSPRPGSSAR